MKTLKKHFEIYKINRRIYNIRREFNVNTMPVYVGGLAFNLDSSPAATRYPDTEKESIMRETINTLLDQRSKLK